MRKLFANIGKTEIRNILAVVVVIGCFALLLVLCVKAVPAPNKDVLNIGIGFVFGGILGSVGSYYFGDTKKNNDLSKKED